MAYGGCGPYTNWIKADTYFRSDYLTILTADSGTEPQVLNCLQQKRWITMVYDIKALWNNSLNLETKFFFFVNQYNADEYQYLCNPRFSLDDNFIPSENLEYTKNDGYIQATCDEFDCMFPIQGASKLPTLAMHDGEVDGRNNVYKYVANTNASINNAMVAASSMALSYDGAMYKLKKLGSHLTFDIYPTKCTDLSFYINYTGLNAKITLGKTSTNLYDKWLTVIADGKIQNTIELNKWQTISIAYLDNYDEKASDASIMFASGNAGDEIYINNVRYMPNDSFIPKVYADERVRPILNNNADGATLERHTDGAYKWAYEYTNSKTDDIANAVRFATVSQNEQKGDFFNNGYRYVKFDALLSQNVTSINLVASGQKNLTAYNKKIIIGQDFVDKDIFVFNSDRIKMHKIEKDTWYTIYIPVLYSSADVGNVDVCIYTNGGSSSAPSVSYVRFIDFAYEVNALFARDYFERSDLVNVEYQTSGEMKNTWKYVNKTSGELPSEDENTKNYGESGVAFDRVTKHNMERADAFFKDGYKWIKLDFLATENVKSLSIRVEGAATNDLVKYWVQKVSVGKSFDANIINVVDSNGNRASKIKINEWYSLYIPVEYTSVPADNSYVMVSLYSNGGSEANPAVMYINNIEYLKQTPEIPQARAMPYGVWASDNSQYFSLEWQEDDSVLYTNTLPDEGYTGFYLKEYYDNKSKEEYANYKFAKMEISIGENTTNLALRINTPDVIIPIGGKLPDNVYLYNVDGSKATTLARNTKYTIYMPISKDDSWDTIYTKGGTADNPAYMSIFSVTYVESKPADNSDFINIFGFWSPGETHSIQWQESTGSVLYTNTSSDTAGNAGFYLKEYYDNKSMPEYVKYKFAKIEFSIGENTTSLAYRMFGNEASDRWVKDIPVDGAVPSNVYLYNADGGKATTLARNTKYTIYMPIANDDNWDTIYTQGGTADKPAYMSIFTLTYVESKPVDNSDFINIFGFWYPGETHSIQWQESTGSVLYTNTSSDTAGNAGFYLKEYYDNRSNTDYAKYKFAKMEFSIGENTTSLAYRMFGNESSDRWVQDILVDGAVPSNVYLYNADSSKATILARNTKYTIYIPISSTDDWDTIYTKGGTADKPAYMSIFTLTYVESKPAV